MNRSLKAVTAILLSAIPILSIELGLEVKGGLNISIQKGTYVENVNSPDSEEPLYRFSGGVALPISLMNSFVIQPELLYSAKGYKAEMLYRKKIGELVYTEKAPAEYKLDYLEIPILVKYNISDGFISPNIYAGPAFSFLINTEYTVEEPITEYEDLSLKSFDFGVAVGAGVNFNLLKGYIITDFRYTFGMLNVCDTPEGGFEYQAQNGAFTALIGYGFNF